MEEFFLCTHFTGTKLNIVDHQQIHLTIFDTEFFRRTVLQRFNEFVGHKCAFGVQNTHIGIVFTDLVTNGIQQVRFPESRSTVNE